MKWVECFFVSISCTQLACTAALVEGIVDPPAQIVVATRESYQEAHLEYATAYGDLQKSMGVENEVLITKLYYSPVKSHFIRLLL